ncbi:MAG: ribosomal protein S18-alanine N-acetyltransferase [Herbaspirillum sp.]
MSLDALLRELENRFGKLAFATMQMADLDELMLIEDRVHAHPWTRGSFQDALRSGYQALTMRDAAGRLLAYFLMMKAMDEAHLLNLSVAEEVQGEGFGHLLLCHAVDLARRRQMKIMLLEVRVSNLRALHVYRCHGFVEIGRRKNYYPVDQHTREDAIVMSLPL